jgi:diguanylate cyclase (GGDEF)-like protein
VTQAPGQQAFAPSAPAADAPPPGHDEHLSRLTATLAGGHAWLRFPRELEAAFQDDCFGPRRVMLALMAVIGLLGYLAVTHNDATLLPDLLPHLQALHRLTLWGGSACLVFALLLSLRWRRGWVFEALMTLNAVVVSLAIVWMGVASHADTAITHTSIVIGVVMFACIAARLRFYWALTCCAVTVIAYGTLVHGHTPWQAMVAQANLTLLTMTSIFTLVVNHAVEHAERRNWLLRQVERHQRGRMLQDTLRLQRLSTEDPLTGLANRRQFDVDLQRAWARAAAADQPLSLVLLDVDHFKAYNDGHGHPQGDDCLQQLAGVLAQWARTHDGLAARLGGEEFALLLPQLRGAAAATVAQGLCEAVAALQRPHRASPVAAHVTVSLGVAEARPQRDGLPQSVCQAADTALYQAKDSGRNRVCLAPPALARGLAPTAAASAAASPAQAPPPDWPALAPDPQAMPVTPEVQRLQSLLHKGLWRLRFPQPMEAAYLAHHEGDRRRHVWRSALAGLFLFNAYLFGSTAHFPDVGAQLWMALAALSLLMVGGVMASSSPKVSPSQREAIYSLGVCVMAMATTWMLSRSQADSVYSFLVCLVLIPLFAGAGARLPFWYAVPPAVVTIGAIVLLFKPHSALAQLLFGDSLVTVTNATVYPLVAAYALDHAERKQWLLSRVADRQRDALAQLAAQLQTLSMTDALTGLPNRRHFEEAYAQQHRVAVREGLPLALLVVDVDHFKRYNDGHGHPAGDACLQEVAEALARVAQASQGQVARLGGEEFGLLLQADAQRARRVAEMACAVVRDRRIVHAHAGPGAAPHLTISVGLSCRAPGHDSTLLHYLAEADEALYRAKSLGRDRVVSLQDLPAPGLNAAPEPSLA